jgi:hypothetical protein
MALTQTAKTSGAISVLITTTTIVPANISRRELTIVNDHATQVLYLALNTTDGSTVPAAVANSGIRLNAAGGSWTTNAYKGPVAGISVGGTSVVTVAEI